MAGLATPWRVILILWLLLCNLSKTLNPEVGSGCRSPTPGTTRPAPPTLGQGRNLPAPTLRERFSPRGSPVLTDQQQFGVLWLYSECGSRSKLDPMDKI
jgi:hypothetical protein